ncbi:hypothetical protein BR93DRAFT_904124 [Coniochaeta sp. PMI_546]|nr:hypothetical protein BR93DRAFT_904124 [Coniochaeta sp. PMI_546]
MSDLEDELLALAGGDVSSDDEQVDISRDASESPAPAPKKNETPARGGAKPPARKGNRDADESEEEGEASSAPGSPDSQGSAAMDESDSDSDAPPAKSRGTATASAAAADDDLNKYPVDGLFISHAEKSEIMSMREIEREQKIAERREEIERIRQNRMLRQLVDNQQDSKKRKAAAAELDDPRGKASRARTKADHRDEPPSKIDSLRKAREERKDRIQQRELENDRRSKRRSPSYRRSASRDSADASDVEWADAKKHRSRTPERKETPEPELRDVERIRVGRTRFAEVCFYPGFEEALTGCYVRINIGPDRDNPAAGDVYRMAVIKGFVNGKAYAMPNRQGKQIVVEGYVKAAHGKAQREWPFIACSDSPFTEAEFNRYKSVCAAESVPIPKRPTFVKKIDDINALVQRPWTEQELAEKISRQNSLKVKYSGIQRERVQKALAEARARGDEARAAQLQEELDGMETPRLAFRTSLTPAKSASGGTPRKEGPTQQERLALLNLENRRKNAEAVRQALLKERARAREAAAAAAAAAEDEKAKRVNGNGNGTTPDGKRGLSQSQSKSRSPSQQQQQQQQVKVGIPTIHKPLMDDDIIGALDLGIDVDIEI